MKTLITVVVAIVLLIVVVPWSRDYVKAKTDVVNSAFKNQIDGDIIVDNVRKDIQRDLENLKDKALKVEVLNNKQSDKETELVNKNSELARQEKLLERSLDWVDNHTSANVLSIGNKAYDYPTVVRDAQARGNECQAKRMVIEALKENIAMLRETIHEARSKVQQEYLILQQRIANLDKQEIILIIDKERRDLERLIADLGIGAPVNSKSRYEEELERRVEKAKVSAKFEKSSEIQGGIIEYPDESVTTKLDAARAYRDTYLKRPAAQVQPASPVTPSASSQASMSDAFLNILPNEN